MLVLFLPTLYSLMNIEDDSTSAPLNEHQCYGALSSHSHNSFYGFNRHTGWVISLAVTTPVGMKGHLMTSGSRWIKGYFRANGKTGERTIHCSHKLSHTALTSLLSLVIFLSVSLHLTTYSDTIDYVKEE